MKKFKTRIITLLIISIIGINYLSCKHSDYVDLGLPSGTLWKTVNEPGYYSFDQAVCSFGENLPTKAQMEELVSHCQWKWTGNGCEVIGPNGKSIIMPAAGWHGGGSLDFTKSNTLYYWTSSSLDSDRAWSFYYGGSGMEVDASQSWKNYCSYSVRLVKNKD